MDHAMLRLLATPKTTATRPSSEKDMHPPSQNVMFVPFVNCERSERIPAAREDAPVGAGAGAVETALAGRAAWGVLGSAAGGHVFVLRGETHVLGGSFGGNRKKKRVAELARAGGQGLSGSLGVAAWSARRTVAMMHSRSATVQPEVGDQLLQFEGQAGKVLASLCRLLCTRCRFLHEIRDLVHAVVNLLGGGGLLCGSGRDLRNQVQPKHQRTSPKGVLRRISKTCATGSFPRLRVRIGASRGCGRILRLPVLQFLQIALGAFPRFLISLGVQRRVGVGVKREDVIAQLRREVGKIVLLKIVEQMRIGRVGERILCRSGVAARVTVGVWKIKLAALDLMQQGMVIVHGLVHALDVHVFGPSGRDLEIESGGRATLGKDAQKKRKDPGSQSWPPISFAPLFFVVRAGHAVQEFLLIEVWRFMDDIGAPVQKCRAGHGGNEVADCPAKAADGQVFIPKYVFWF